MAANVLQVVTLINDALAVATLATRAIQAAQSAGVDVTDGELRALRDRSEVMLLSLDRALARRRAREDGNGGA